MANIGKVNQGSGQTKQMENAQTERKKSKQKHRSVVRGIENTVYARERRSIQRRMANAAATAASSSTSAGEADSDRAALATRSCSNTDGHECGRERVSPHADARGRTLTLRRVVEDFVADDRHSALRAHNKQARMHGRCAGRRTASGSRAGWVRQRKAAAAATQTQAKQAARNPNSSQTRQGETD